MTVQMVRKRGSKGVGVPSGVSADSFEREKEKRRVIDVVYEPDASNSIEGIDKLNREIYRYPGEESATRDAAVIVRR